MSRINPRFVRGFARMVLEQGHGAKAPSTRKDRDGRDIIESWQEVGRRLYGAQLFNQVLREEIAARKGNPDAEGRVSAI